MAINQETMMAVISAAREMEDLLIAFREEIAKAFAKEPYGATADLFTWASSHHPTHENIKLITRLEQYYIMARHKNNYKRKWEAKRQGREVKEVMLPQGFGKVTLPPAGQIKTLSGYNDPKVSHATAKQDSLDTEELTRQTEHILSLYDPDTGELLNGNNNLPTPGNIFKRIP